MRTEFRDPSEPEPEEPPDAGLSETTPHSRTRPWAQRNTQKGPCQVIALRGDKELERQL